MAIWVLKDGQREGPYEEQDVRELVYEGTYTDSDAAIRDGQFDWSTVGQLLGREAQRTPLPPLEPVVPAEFSSPTAPEPPPLLIPPEPAPMGGIASIAEPEPPSIPAPPSELPPNIPEPMPVAVVDFQMPFGSMVVFMVKWVIASIPALLILGIIAAIFWSVFLSMIALLLRH